MDEYSNLVNLLSCSELPINLRTATKFARHNFKQVTICSLYFLVINQIVNGVSQGGAGGL